MKGNGGRGDKRREEQKENLAEPRKNPPGGGGGVTMLRGLMLRMEIFSSFLMFSKYL